MKVTLDTIFGEILEDYPASEDVLRKFLGEAYCLTCPGKMFDNIGNGAMIHGLSDEAATEMVKDLQAVVDAAEGVEGNDHSAVDSETEPKVVPEHDHGAEDHAGHDHSGHSHDKDNHAEHNHDEVENEDTLAEDDDLIV
ncbi:MAG: hypothetical protein COW24_03280 [Candidatus Kerfeldbacteria bacterium CG15_BIG_FIL_POST_REV_8_21_14_020_45_12]|uniref:DUF1858 domain-containing protein n=1 Tax=Candidatus Kerfeldbacteria bacterium CG15_BIG_FIL_POST_REV_8_21_14_020_45_12 TaxID=2014247 RepID=A0A2M7H3M8_9BACT|nr:MAG: hypothetical protein COW24_03280 [Candidatus Kerfeldbacteria bacterium CG15_BIG_FIL_POST_REV_8_21_14_020_45_12]PJA93454.1 MAG: hypothetical protein CO132_03085 [Candidatus Kerfeldbacteria bacterium CG_4_9_14_3_um_filter_45_8]